MKRRNTEKGLSFQWKLTLHFIALSLILLVTALFLLSRFAYDLSLKKVSADYERATSSAQHLLSLRVQSVGDSLQSALSDPIFRSELARAREGSLDLGLSGSPKEGLASSHRVFSSATMPLLIRERPLAILSADGKLIYSREHRELYGTDWTPLPQLSLMKKGESVLWIADGSDPRLQDLGLFRAHAPSGPTLVIGLPIRAGESLLGMLLVGEPFTQSLFSELESIAGAAVYIDMGSDTYAGRTDLIPQADIPHLKTKAGQVLKTELGGQSYLAALLPLKIEASVFGHALVLRNLDSEMSALQSGLRQALLKILLLSLIASTLTAMQISTHVTRALTALRSAVRRVQKGDLNVELTPLSGDELGQLTKAFNDMTAGLRQRELLKNSFKQYVGGNLVDEIIRTDSAPHIKGDRQVATVFFSDVQGFTRMVELGEPATFLRELNNYLAFMTARIQEHQGVVDKFVGDAVMAVWGPGQAELACRAALAIQAAGHPWVTRIGINTGEVLVGNIGSQDRLQYTAIGDPVNIAARLEGLNKSTGTCVLVSDSTRKELAGSPILFRDLGTVILKGKISSLRVHEAYAAEPSKQDREFCTLFEKALAQHELRLWSESLASFEACLKLRPKDPPSKLYAERARGFLSRPPADDDPLHLPSV